MSEGAADPLNELLLHWAQGDEQALGRLIPIVYRELRRLAHAHLTGERADHTLQITALVNEAFVRLLGAQPPELLRQILVDYARHRQAGKRDGGQCIQFEALAELPVQDDAQLIALDDALSALAHVDERQARVVDMKFFGGLTAPQLAAVQRGTTPKALVAALRGDLDAVLCKALERDRERRYTLGAGCGPAAFPA